METKKEESIISCNNVSKYVEQYYKTSTFHHLSTWRLETQQRVAELQSKTKRENDQELADLNEFVGVRSSNSSKDRLWTLIDLDSFYVSVAVRDDPTLQGQPVAVVPASARESNGTSEVASCSYAARQYGVKARMLLQDARKLCPELIVVTCQYDKYEKVSRSMFDIFAKYTTVIQAASVDEAYLDLSEHCTKDTIEILVRQIREEIFEATGVTASAGISHNKLLCKLANKKAKPNGQLRIRLEEAEEFISDFPVDELPNVGKMTKEKLAQKQVHNVGQLRQLSRTVLQGIVGESLGTTLWNFARGIDERPLVVEQERKSVGTQISWGVRYTSLEKFEEFLQELAIEVAKRLQQIPAVAKKITLTIKQKKEGGKDSVKKLNPGDVDIINRSMKVENPTDVAEVIASCAKELFKKTNISVVEVRGVGLHASEFVKASGSKDMKRTPSLERYLKPTLPIPELEKDSKSGSSTTDAKRFLPSKSSDGKKKLKQTSIVSLFNK